MAQSKGKQRGVIRVASSAFLALVGALLGVTGCSSADEIGEGSGGAEHVASAELGLTCGKITCAPDTPCTTHTCLGLSCITKTVSDGDACVGVKGACIQGVCCEGCVRALHGGGYACEKGTELTACGLPGKACENCDKGDSCTTYECNAKRACELPLALGDGEKCKDGSGQCFGGACCAGCLDSRGTCRPGTGVDNCGTFADLGKVIECANCDDGNQCSQDACSKGQCADPVALDGVSCGDGNACNGAETCKEGKCGGGANLDCDDKNPCTADSCDPDKGCVNVAVEAGTSCDDGNLCNGISKCDGKVCKPGAPPNCLDDNPCTTDSCNPNTGQCVNANNSLNCEDGDPCTTGDKCNAGACAGTGTLNCEDGNPCTSDSCKTKEGCKHDPVANNTGCDDGNDCSSGDSCQNGKCLSSGGKMCPDEDDNPCTKPACNPADQLCTNPNVADSTPCQVSKCKAAGTCQAGTCEQGADVSCDDSNPCTDDSCDPEVGCKHVNNDTPSCMDGDPCTTGDHCSAGACVGTEIGCSAIDGCHVAGSCTNGVCNDPRAPDDTACDSDSGTCHSGLCVPNAETGGAGGEGPGESPGGANAGGNGSGEAGQAGEASGVGGDADGTAGDSSEPGQGGSSTAGVASNAAGEGEVPEHPFVRDPGGCACGVAGGDAQHHTGWLAALALAGAVALVRRRAKPINP